MFPSLNTVLTSQAVDPAAAGVSRYSTSRLVWNTCCPSALMFAAPIALWVMFSQWSSSVTWSCHVLPPRVIGCELLERHTW